MSEFTNRRETRVEQLVELFQGILKGENPGETVKQNQKLIQTVVPSDVVYAVDILVQMKIPMDKLKTGINKWINLLYKTISEHPYFPPEKNSYFGVLTENNRLLDQNLKTIRPLLREINGNPENKKLQNQLLEKFIEIEKIGLIYQIKENILFPVIEKHIPEFRCLSLMWSFHDDIKRNLKEIIEKLQREILDLKAVNKLAGDLFFNIYAIKFREERILYPLVQGKIDEKILNSLWQESLEIGFPFYQPEIDIEIEDKNSEPSPGVDLGTGAMSAGQIRLLFNHLPVDITFVDENNKVVYFSTPKKRIFRRTKSIIGRDVHHCHPPESVHMVEKIVESFKSGKKEFAQFWINMKGERLLIQYFAIRDENGNYKGVVEVSQEITEIQNLKGEKRLLDWED
jgi:PAS domain S-box-containing protein